MRREERETGKQRRQRTQARPCCGSTVREPPGWGSLGPRSPASPRPLLQGENARKSGFKAQSARGGSHCSPLERGVPIACPGAGSARWPLEGQEGAPIPSPARRSGNGFFPSGLHGKCGWAGGEGLWGVESGIPSLPGPLIASLGCFISPEFWLWGPRHAEEPEEGKGQAPFTCGQEQPSR